MNGCVALLERIAQLFLFWEKATAAASNTAYTCSNFRKIRVLCLALPLSRHENFRHPDMNQNYKNHVRYYAPHHFVFLPLSAAFTVATAIKSGKSRRKKLLWGALSGAGFLVTYLGLMTRQHYALELQDRIVRLEMRLRYYQLTGKRLEPLENTLGFGRIAALRFASDEELPALLDRALNERLSADEIKKAITNWQADTMRV